MAGPSGASQSRLSEASGSHQHSPSQNGRRKKRGTRKNKRTRTKSFISPPDGVRIDDSDRLPSSPPGREGFFAQRRNSNTSLDSEALLDHRGQNYPRMRRPSTVANPLQMPRPNTGNRSRAMTQEETGSDEDGHSEDEANNTEIAPLLLGSTRLFTSSQKGSQKGYGAGDSLSRSDRQKGRRGSSRSSRKLYPGGGGPRTPSDTYNINYPPSMPGSPVLGSSARLDMPFGDVMMRDELISRSPGSISPRDDHLMLDPTLLERRQTIARQAEEDVCFPQEMLSELGDDEMHPTQDSHRSRRRRRKKWPDLAILDEWYRLEKEGRSEGSRMKKITEPQLVDGRLRPIHKGWYSAEEDAPYRFTYFNEEFPSTIHSQTISELVQSDAGFKELFIPDPPILSDSSDSESENDEQYSQHAMNQVPSKAELGSRLSTQQPSRASTRAPSDHQSEAALSPRAQPVSSATQSKLPSEETTPLRPRSVLSGTKSPPRSRKEEKKPRYGERPVWWLDVLSPTESEMKYLSKAFGIHPLTSEDIMLQEQREKVELFRHYYFVNYRSFDQDRMSDNHLEPVNMYVVVFREGVISFHFSQTPHPANVRRRIRQLKDFMILSSDWISYAIIDDITDVYLPLIQDVEEEVDDIDDAILELHSPSDPPPHGKRNNVDDEKASTVEADSEGDMLRRVGDCRKKVMRLYRLLGNKADVIKGFAKRCNEHWEVAPRSEIGLYLGDIQDHIVTMTGNLSHYEMILARCHANYIAQINIRMNERQEATADGLNKLTVLGTIVLPMNIITGLWGMNVWVPGQEYEGNLAWFFCITGGLLIFGVACFYMAKWLYKII